MNCIGDRIEQLKTNIPNNVRLVAVSKFHEVSKVLDAYNVGQKVFGESRVQEFLVKYKQLPKDIEWHFIGHLQRNKVKDIIPTNAIIESVDSQRLLDEILREAEKKQKRIRCFLQIYIASEETKYGLSLSDCEKIISSPRYAESPFIEIGGIMGMATNTDDKEKVRSEFKELKNIFDYLKSKYFSQKEYFSDISMGMSQDFELAIEEGSTNIRIGSLIFGDRN